MKEGASWRSLPVTDMYHESIPSKPSILIIYGVKLVGYHVKI